MNKPIVSLLIAMLMGFVFSAKSENIKGIATDTILISDSAFVVLNTEISGLSLEKQTLVKDTLLRKKAVSALFAFPFPFGFMGAHRVMLGTKPWVPVVYVATFGGCFGLLPMIDFFVIVFSKDIEQYENNPNIFMWVK